MSKKAAPKINDRIQCPYCGKLGTVIRAFGDGSLNIVHRLEWGEVKSDTTGLMIKCEVVRDACMQGTKMGTPK